MRNYLLSVFFPADIWRDWFLKLQNISYEQLFNLGFHFRGPICFRTQPSFPLFLKKKTSLFPQAFTYLSFYKCSQWSVKIEEFSVTQAKQEREANNFDASSTWAGTTSYDKTCRYKWMAIWLQVHHTYGEI